MYAIAFCPGTHTLISKVFIEHRAVAAIAIAYPVSDLFAAAFAKVFCELFVQELVVD